MDVINQHITSVYANQTQLTSTYYRHIIYIIFY